MIRLTIVDNIETVNMKYDIPESLEATDLVTVIAELSYNDILREASISSNVIKKYCEYFKINTTQYTSLDTLYKVKEQIIQYMQKNDWKGRSISFTDLKQIPVLCVNAALVSQAGFYDAENDIIIKWVESYVHYQQRLACITDTVTTSDRENSYVKSIYYAFVTKPEFVAAFAKKECFTVVHDKTKRIIQRLLDASEVEGSECKLLVNGESCIIKSSRKK